MRDIERKAGEPHGKPLSAPVEEALTSLRASGGASIPCKDRAEAKRVQTNVLTVSRRYVEGGERVASRVRWSKGAAPVVEFTLVRAAEVA